MARPVHHVYVSVGQPFPTGQECPSCNFDSIVAALVIFNSKPDFYWLCGRGCPRPEPTGNQPTPA